MITARGIPVAPEQTSSMLFARYQNIQMMIGSRVSSAIAGFWNQTVDPYHFSNSWRILQPLIAGIVDTHHQMSAADASNYYGLSRAVAGYYGTMVPGIRIDSDYLNHVVNVMGNGQFYHHLKVNDEETASALARDALCGASLRLVMNGGRDTVTKAAAGDDIASGWERIAESEPCSYCAMLAASGGIHKAAYEPFHAHDHCQCLARVVFKGQGSANTALAEEWSRATAGKSGKGAIAAWNQYWSEKNGSTGNSSSGTEAQTTATGQGTGDAAVQDQSVQLA